MQEFTYECEKCRKEFTDLAHIGRAEENPPCPLPSCSGFGVRVYEMPEVVLIPQQDPLSILIETLFGAGVDRW